MTAATHLLLIDAQNDFCDLPDAWLPPDPIGGGQLRPALPVAGAHADLLRVAALIGRLGPALAAITATLDSHHHVDVAHPAFWQTGAGAPVAPFTPITAAQVRAGAYAPRDGAALGRVLAYLDALEARGRYTLMVWPAHCEIGAWGHGLHAAVRAACNVWAEAAQAQVDFVLKGDNPWTEHYSALQAEVPDPADARTTHNAALVARLAPATRILVAGEASSHCVRATVEHLMDHLPGSAARVVLLTDAMSPVAGFEREAEGFLAAMRARGLTLARCADVQP